MCTRVAKSDIDDWGKLKRVIECVQCTIYDVMIIEEKYKKKHLRG